MNTLLKKVVPSVLVLALLVLGGMWLYGYLGVKCGWVGVTEVRGLNAISRHGADAAGGMTGALKTKASQIKADVGL